MKNKRMISVLVLLTLAVSFALSTAGYAEPKTVHISTVEDLRKLAQNCRLDAYSDGLTVILDSDLDLGGAEIEPIPIFSGSFFGSGHTISGFRLATDGSHQGFFRYIEEKGVVQDLNLSGTVAPEGSREKVGGLVGTNRGTVSACSFDGSVSGVLDVGSICGENLGTITNCSSYGTVSGKTHTGGTVGFNSGTVQKCISSAKVNTTITFSNIELESFNLTSLASAEDSDTVSDMGGIAGISTGVITGCVNNGAVGYQHYGYNVGGIVGRQSGYVTGCTNTAQVSGRKDIGGIVGQMEPYMELTISEDIVEELAILRDLTDTALIDANGQSSNMTDALDRISDNSSDAADSASELVSHVGGVLDDSIDAVNEVIDRMNYIVDMLPPVTDHLTVVTQNTSEGLIHLDNCFDSIEMDSETLSRLHNDMDAIADSMEALDAELAYLKYMIAVYYNKELDGHYDLDELRPANADELKAKYGYNFDLDGKSSLSKIRGAIGDVMSDIAGDLSRLNGATSDAIQLLDDYYLEPYFDTDGDGEPDQCRADYATDEGSLARENFKIAADHLSSAMQGIDNIITHLSELDDVRLPNLGSTYYTASDELFKSLHNLAGNMGSLNASLYQGSDVLTYDLVAVNAQFSKVLTMLADAITGGVNVMVIEDLSDKDDGKSTDGKVSASKNLGSVDGDIDVGGVAGSMGIEYDFDLEGEIKDGIQSNSVLSRTYATKCVIQDCENRAQITGKKDYVGGIVGVEELGTVIGCDGFGSVESTGGSYVGGIVGSSSTIVRSCCAMCNLGGTEYVGGIAGFGTEVTGCRTLVGISDTSACCGAIVGGALLDEEETIIKDNCFVHEELGGIDGISYVGKAEPMAYEDFIKLEKIPEDFSKLTLTFMANGQPLKTVSFPYGGSVSESEIPAVPEREGFTGHWPEYDYSTLYFSDTIEAVYIPEQATMAADAVREGSPMSILLVEGSFEDGAKVSITPYTGGAPVFAEDSGTEVSEMWVMRISSANELNFESYSVRYLPAENGKRVKIDIYVLGDDGIWEKVTTGTSGSYMTFDCGGDTVVFCAAKTVTSFRDYLFGGGIVGAVAMGAGGVGISVSGKKRRKKRAEERAMQRRVRKTETIE